MFKETFILVNNVIFLLESLYLRNSCYCKWQITCDTSKTSEIILRKSFRKQLCLTLSEEQQTASIPSTCDCINEFY